MTRCEEDTLGTKFSRRHRSWLHNAMSALVMAVATLAASSSASADIKSDLRAGKIITMSVPGKSGWPGRAMAAVNAPAQRVFNILRDVDKYRYFMPRITRSKKIASNTYELAGTLPWPLSKTWIRLRLNAGKRGKVFVVSWKMFEGTLKRHEGTAWVHPWGKQRCVLTYQLLTVPKIPTPSGLMNRGMRNAVKWAVDAVRKRATHAVSKAKLRPDLAGSTVDLTNRGRAARNGQM